MRPYIGAREFLQGGDRWILALHETSPSKLRGLPLVRQRIAAVRKYRSQSKSKPTRELAETPTLYHVNVIPDAPYLVVPKVSSERRQYVPCGWITPPFVPSDLLFVLPKATLADFALVSSAMHMAWMRAVAGRMKSDYRYSVSVVYNTYPLPRGFSDGSASAKLDAPAQAVLDARAAHPDATLADLYDPDLMPATLRRAHLSLDRAVDRLYRRERFKSENDRLEHLFGLYERMQAPLVTETVKQGRRRRRRSTAAACCPRLSRMRGTFSRPRQTSSSTASH